MDRRIRDLEALTAHLRHTHVSTNMAPSYTSPGQNYPFSTPSFQQNFGMTSMMPAYTSPGYTQAATGGNYPFSTPSFQQNFGMPTGDYYKPQMMEPGPSVISGLVVVGISRICKSTLGLE
ncbi:hypothetical protein L6452_08250 [Arctium lappa]|uniref:Uncharacterized protein n=1 Tax=Arctium lappa TaxID=4217 RepID=A0ACB9DGQ6_ARCLA|nr:hypothetical protein L6452_08250 [Arctium lappa]